MSIFYDGEHSITVWKALADSYPPFDYNDYDFIPTRFWSDLHLIPASRPYFAIPNVNYQIVQRPHSDDRINITDFIPGEQTYGPIQGEWEFYIDHNQYESWTESYDRLQKVLDGSSMYVAIDDDHCVIYKGRLWVSNYEAGSTYSTVTIKYDLDYETFAQQDVILGYSIRWFDYDGSLLRERVLGYNNRNVARLSPTPSVIDGYEFSGWSPTISNVEYHQDYHPIYVRANHKMIFINDSEYAICVKTRIPQGVTFVQEESSNL